MDMHLKKIISLDESNFIAKGQTRSCYCYPMEEEKVIKIFNGHAKFGDCRSRDSNIIESKYLAYVQSRHGEIKHIPRYFETVNTNLGTGYVFERIIDYDKSTSKSLHYYLTQNLINIESAKKLISNLFNYLLKFNISIVDRSLANIVLQKQKCGTFIPYLIDGFGAHKDGFQLFRNMHIPFYAKYVTNKKLNSILSRLDVQYQNEDKIINDVNINKYVKNFTLDSDLKKMDTFQYFLKAADSLRKTSQLSLTGFNNNDMRVYKLKPLSSLKCHIHKDSKNNKIIIRNSVKRKLNLTISGSNNIVYLDCGLYKESDIHIKGNGHTLVVKKDKNYLGPEKITLNNEDFESQLRIITDDASINKPHNSIQNIKSTKNDKLGIIASN